jgi:hypothetical protein
MSRYWFRPKRYGYGATPITWEGWVFTLAIVLVDHRLRLANARHRRAARHRDGVGLVGDRDGGSRRLGRGDESQDRGRLAMAVGTRPLAANTAERTTENGPDRCGAWRHPVTGR